MIMQNIDCIMNSKVLFKFDLKMSTMDRTVFPAEKVNIIKQYYLKNYPKANELFPNFNSQIDLSLEKETIEKFQSDKLILKDKDFENFLKPLPISAKPIELMKWIEIKEIVQKDLVLLQSLNLMDYSLILCVIDCSNEEDNNESSSFRSEESKGNDILNQFNQLIRDKTNHLYSPQENFIYVLGIIDIFQKYDIQKKSEKLIKDALKLTKGGKKIEDPSVKDSQAYAERFLSNLDTLFNILN